MNRCVVCGNKINRNKAHIQIEHKGTRYLVCCPLCQSEFEKDPEMAILKSAKFKGNKTV